MHELKALATLVNRQKVKQIDILDSKSRNNQTYKLYQYISDQENPTDSEAINLLYRGNLDKHLALNKSKQRLKKKLLNTLLFLDVNLPSYTEYRRAYQECLKSWVTCKILIDKGVKKLAVDEAEKTLHTCLKFGFSDLIVLLCLELFLHFGTQEYKKGRFERYLELGKKHQYYLLREIEITELYSKFFNFFLKSHGSIPKEAIQFGKEAIERIKPLMKEIPTFKFQFTARVLISTYFEVTNDLNRMLIICKESFRIFMDSTKYPRNGVLFFGPKLVVTHLKTKNYAHAEKIANEVLPFYNPGTLNWFYMQIYLILLYFHSGKYNNAVVIFARVINHRNYRSIPHNIREFWIIVEPYVQFLIQSRVVLKSEAVDKLRKFRLYKFLNEVPLYSKDKRGFNISILIAHVLLLLVTKKYDRIIDRVETLNQYCYRYLRKDDTYRSNCFIKMLLQLPKAGFNHLRAERYAENYYKKLLNVPLEISTQPTEVELIPYEDLWRMVIDVLRNEQKT